MCHRQENCLMTSPYRVRRGIQRFLVTVGVLTLLTVIALVIWVLWLSRYVIYTDEGAKLDFSLSFDQYQGEIAKPPATTPSVPISYGQADEIIQTPTNEMKKLSGYVITEDMLKNDLDAVKAALENIPATSTILLDVKTLRGEFYYASSLGRNPAGADTEAITQLIRDLNSKGHYLVARMPAFRDFWYFIDDEAGRVPYGLPQAGGNGSLWEDRSVPNMTHYWFNPASNGALNYLVQIATELRSLGFDEVLFSDFRFPNTEGIRFEGDKTEALNKAAKTLVQACSTDAFTVSFVGNHFTLPEGKCRVYMENVAAVDIPQILNAMTLEDPNTQLVFLTDFMDTRYDEYSVLRPLEIITD